jgi:hypothetical protein
MIASLIDLYKTLKNGHSELDIIKDPLDNHFFNTTLIRSNKFLGLVFKGLTNQASHKIDSQIGSAVRNKLFRPFEALFGSDLAALNIQRGRAGILFEFLFDFYCCF